mgnify:CR=1 FL=1
MKYKAIYISDENNKKTLGTFDDRKDAVDKLINEASKNYCLDDERERRNTMEYQDYCILGCGPSMIMIEEV